MIISKIYGGLGNQMFQYATARAFAESCKQPLFIDTSVFKEIIPNVDPRLFELNIFPNIRINYIEQDETEAFYQQQRLDVRIKKKLGLKVKQVFQETVHAYNPSINNVKPPVLFDGHFQSEKYFATYQDLILKEFQFPQINNSDKNILMQEEIRNSYSVAVHVRRGDYIKYAPTNAFHGVCSTDYYQRAIRYFTNYSGNCRFYFFSDDPVWVTENLIKNNLDACVVDINKGVDSWKDMWLMSFCRHHIIANSSFSWWGAWLNKKKDKKIIAPLRWFQSDDPFFEPNDVVPEDWIRM